MIVRSASAEEDHVVSSNAGKYLSVVVYEPSTFGESVFRVAEAISKVYMGGAVFVQPFLTTLEAGIAVFDGFYFERTTAPRENLGLTSGILRGDVCRGHLARGDDWSAWLTSIYDVFGSKPGERQAVGQHSRSSRRRSLGYDRVDVEFGRDEQGYILYQVRPALFPVRRNQTLSLTNVRETVGEAPSPWIRSILLEASKDMSFLADIDAKVARWDDTPVVELAGRLWMNLSLAFRIADELGLPRKMIIEGLGGHSKNPADARVLLGRFLGNLPRVTLSFCRTFRLACQAEQDLRRLDKQIDATRDLVELHDAGLQAGRRLMITAVSIVSFLAILYRVRQVLRLPPAARLVTQTMMDEYHKLAGISNLEAREVALDQWLVQYGHRGPFESDFASPRFQELRDVLLQDLASPAKPSSMEEAGSPRKAVRLARFLFWPLYRLDERREWFRDEVMRRWQRVRLRMLEEGRRLVDAGRLDEPSDVFWLRGSDLQESRSLREAVATAKVEANKYRDLVCPLNATREEIESILTSASRESAARSGRREFPGVALGPAVVEGRAVKANDLIGLLQGNGRLGSDAILVVPSLEPAWAVVFPRVAGVVSEVGGELSHASILLRESGRPGIVNCTGIFSEVQAGDRLRLDGKRGLVELLQAGDS